MSIPAPNQVYFAHQRPMDEETLPLPPRTEKASPSKRTASSLLRVFGPIASPFLKPTKQVPAKDAKPAEIREYLSRLLIQQCGLPDDEAESVVSAWKVGSGLELRQYGAAMYLELFGREHGWILYREVKIGVRKETRLVFRYPLHSCTIATVGVAASSIAILATLEVEEGLTIFLVMAAFFSLIGCFVCLGLQCWCTSASKMIERELRSATKVQAQAEKAK